MTRSALETRTSRPPASIVMSFFAAMVKDVAMTPDFETMTYERDGRIARITLDRPERGKGTPAAMPRELAACVERANLDPEVHVIALAGNGTGFCGGYDLVESAEGMGLHEDEAVPAGSPLDPFVMAKNHDPN